MFWIDLNGRFNVTKFGSSIHFYHTSTSTAVDYNRVYDAQQFVSKFSSFLIPESTDVDYTANR